MPTIGELTEAARRAITAGRYDYAIGAANHILSHYPKCLEAYSLIGRACTEKGLLDKAEHLYKLVLSADPEDYEARIGLAVVLRDQGNLQAAIEQLTIALEVRPYSMPIRKEIKRLQNATGEGAEGKIKLTRTALARLYAKDSLYWKAADELRAVLKIDPARLDAMVSLAEILWLAGKKIEAYETCLSITNLSPDCLKPKLIAAEIQFSDGYITEATALLMSARNVDPANKLARSLLAEREVLSILPPDIGFDIPALGTRENPLLSAANHNAQPWGTEDAGQDGMRSLPTNSSEKGV